MGHSIAISAGEASGDLNGAFLVERLRGIRDDLSFWGAGGARMRQAGVRIIADSTGGGAISVSESLKSVPALAVRYLRLRREMARSSPDLFVPIDFGAFNITLAKAVHKRGISVVYYFPPSSWRRRPTNAPKLKACGGKVITPFAWSAERLSAEGVDARFVGHPLVDIVEPTVGRADFLAELGLGESLPTIGLIPGTRGHEMREHLPPMIGSAQIISRRLGGAQFLICAAHNSGKIRGYVDAAARRADNLPEIRVVEGRAYDCMAACDLLITKSGTATIEAAILGTPMLIVYRGSAMMRFEFLFRKSVLDRFIGMPNLIANRSICPELINEHVSATNLADAALELLADRERLSAMKASLAEVRAQLGEPGAADRAARTLLEMGGLA